jgi:oligopeptide/dipeptide ABC transporter ATP-binding protein
VTTAQLLSVRGLKVHYERRGVNVRAVDGIDLDLARGETLGLVGESGCGKSTVAKAVVRLIQPTEGRIEFEGRDIATLGERDLKEWRPRIQMIFQDPYASLNPRMCVHDWIAEPLKIHSRGDRVQRTARVRDLIDRVGLSRTTARRYPSQLSGGQRQRVGIARALALDPDLLVADEPTSALDVSIQAQVLALLAEIQRDLGLSYLFISHDLGAVRQLSQEIAVMYLGRLCETGPARRVLDQPAHPYTVALLSAAPVPDPAVESARERIVLRGDPPSPADPPSGCRFHTRCWLRESLGDPDLCATTDPPATPAHGGGHVHCHFHDHIGQADGARTASQSRRPPALQGGAA